MVIFQTQVKEIGLEAEMLKEEHMMVLFGEDAPPMLAEFCYNIELHKSTAAIIEGMELIVDDTHYLVTAVGNLVRKNLDDLGHISIKFDGATVAELPGTLYVEAKELPDIKVGSVIMIA